MEKWKALDELIKGASVIDLSPRIEHGMPKWPTHPMVIVDATVTQEHDGYFCQTLVMGEHTGAHVDAPAHVVRGMTEWTIDRFPADILIGPAIHYDLSRFDPQPGERITIDQIRQLEEEMGDHCREGDIVLLDFGWQKYWTCGPDWIFYGKNQPGLDEETCRLFAERGVKAVGADTVACDTPVKDGFEYESFGHYKYWLPNKIFIMEMLMNLNQLPHRCDFIATPLFIKGGSGSPIRPVAIVIVSRNLESAGQDSSAG